jgi:predicted transcriptional regulator of viral defense system
MKLTDAYAELRRLGSEVLTTREAQAAWGVQQRTASRRLRSLHEAGLVSRIRQGLWSLDPQIDPFKVASYLTAPLPAYVSLWSALYRHGMIEQIPRSISVISLDRTRQIPTALGLYEIHHLAPQLFLGFSVSTEGDYLASAEKALFDTVYIRAAAGGVAHFPELWIPADFNRAHFKQWSQRIESKRLQTLVRRRLREVTANAQ